MISHTIPESDTKMIPDFAFVSSFRRTVIFRLFLLRSETAPPPILKSGSSHIGWVSATFRRSVNMFSGEMSRREHRLGPT